MEHYKPLRFLKEAFNYITQDYYDYKKLEEKHENLRIHFYTKAEKLHLRSKGLKDANTEIDVLKQVVKVLKKINPGKYNKAIKNCRKTNNNERLLTKRRTNKDIRTRTGQNGNLPRHWSV